MNRLQSQTDGPADHPPLCALAQHLAAAGDLPAQTLQKAQRDAQRRGVRLADILQIEYNLSARRIATAEAAIFQTAFVDPADQPPDPSLALRLSPQKCIRFGALPWRRIGTTTVILTAQPERFERHQAALTAVFGDVRMAVTTQAQLHQAIGRIGNTSLITRAETRVPLAQSSRTINPKRIAAITVLLVLSMIALNQIAQATLVAILCGIAILVLAANTLLKIAAIWLDRHPPAPLPLDKVVSARLPVITLLIPLYKERAIATHLLSRLRALDYPEALLDVCIVLEDDDETTRTTIGQTTFPTWLRAITVPKGTLRTKPRALNYALDFARGSIIGVYDAEDAPDPQQLRVVAQYFASRGPEVACLQGVLDYYNSAANWMTRCFTIEYASWFRVILPGFERMGLVVPLGGTTLFFRRNVLEELRGWDAHNVTEDADLGVRLARFGYRTELIRTVTEEEANGRFWPWVKQRSRWLKGYAVTYGVHMRNPRKLWRDLGAWRFLGVQLLFGGTLLQFLLAPALWSFWLLPLGYGHPMQTIFPPWAFWAFGGLFVASELVNLWVAAIAVRKADKGWLVKWAPTLHFYFPLAAIAAYKGIVELAWKPFYWDKTTHGVLMPDLPVSPPPAPPLRPVSNVSRTP